MVKFAAEQVRGIMELKDNIRNVAVIGHVNHGKSTLVDSLVAEAGIITQEVDGDNDLVIKSSGLSLCYEIDSALKGLNGERNGNKYIMNLIDSPGHVDFSSEVSAALRVSDGALLVVDCNEGVCIQTKSVLRQAFHEKVRHVLTVNKIEGCFLGPEADGERAYQLLQSVIKTANDTMTYYKDPLLGDGVVDPQKGTVAFSAGLHGWGFTFSDIVKFHKTGNGEVDEAKLLSRLWGENYVDTETKTWTKQHTGKKTCKRGFVHLCYEPIKRVVDACLNGVDVCADGQRRPVRVLVDKLGLDMTSEERDLTGKKLMKCVMRKWFPAGSALLEMMTIHLPSPQTAQRYRVETLYQGPPDDKYATAIRNCDPNGPLMVYVSRMIYSPRKKIFYAFGRVFSGRVSSGLKVKIMGPDAGADSHIDTVQETYVWMGSEHLRVEDVPCGNTVTLSGVDRFINKTATMTNEGETEANKIQGMKYSMVPVVHATVQCKSRHEDSQPRLIEGLELLSKSDLQVVCRIDRDSGKHVIECVGELHLKACEKNLKKVFATGEGLSYQVSRPFAPFCETVLENSSRTVMSKSENGRNRLYMRAIAMDIRLADAIDFGQVGALDDLKHEEKLLSIAFPGEKDVAMKIWCLGPKETGPNLLIDRSKGVEHLDEIKESVIAGFQCATQEGALTSESMRGICFEVCDAMLQVDATHRDSEQVKDTTSRAIYASQLSAKPRLVEPLYWVEIQAPEKELVLIRNMLKHRRGYVFREERRLGTEFYTIQAYLPVAESFGFSVNLKAASTSGSIRLQCMFDHWNMITSDPLEDGSLASTLVYRIRQRKGLEAIKPLSAYEDN